MCTYLSCLPNLFCLLYTAILIGVLVCLIQVALMLNTARRMVQRLDYMSDVSYWATFIKKWWKKRRD